MQNLGNLIAALGILALFAAAGAVVLWLAQPAPQWSQRPASMGRWVVIAAVAGVLLVALGGAIRLA